jgi:hypothetical protein
MRIPSQILLVIRFITKQVHLGSLITARALIRVLPQERPSPRTLPVGSLGDPNNPAYTLTGLDDNESYYFVVTAYDDEGFESDYSNEVPGTTPMNDTTPGGGGCLIATAAYGSCIAKEVVALRKFRDHKNSLGRSFEFYYKIYPLITYYTGGHETLRTAARLALTQVVYSVKYP